jgi:mono/diheme cytochrome c family protein
MTFKEKFFGRVFTLRNMFVGGNVVLLLLFLAVLVKDARREWKPYQKTFFAREKARLATALKAAGPEEREKLERESRDMGAQSVHIRQILLPAFDRFDRCTTCHLGMDSSVTPSLRTSYTDQPFAAPDIPVHAAHPAEKFGCTVCHEGQGLATTVKAAHGDVHHWEKPLRRGALIQASCAKCHNTLEDAAAMPQTGAWRRGRELFVEKGCIGCHQIRGTGGPVSVDLAEETADKPLSRIDFSHTGLAPEERTLSNWIKLHFTKPPSELAPGDPEARVNDEPIAPSGMPFLNLSNEDAEALTAYVLSLGRDLVPPALQKWEALPAVPEEKDPLQRGRRVYEKFGCAACHGPDGKGGIPNFNYKNDVEPDLTKVMGTYTREELREKLEKGVPVVDKKDPHGPTPPLYMPPWKDKIKGQELEDLMTYLLSIGEKQEEW